MSEPTVTPPPAPPGGELKHLVVRKPIFAALVALMLGVMGLSALSSVPLEQAPEVTIGVFLVNVVYPGAGPEDVEREISRPLENALRSVRNVEWVQTQAGDGISISTVRLADGANIELARRDVRRSVDLARSELPADAEEPVIQEVAFDDVPIIYIALAGPSDPVRLRKLAEELRDEIETIPGISDVEIFGGAKREVRVRLDPERMRALQVDVGQVAMALGAQSRSAPPGQVDVGRDRTFLVRTIGAFDSVGEIGDVVVRTGSGAPVRLSDVARVQLEPERKTTEARTDEKVTTTLLVRKETGVSTIPTAEAAKVKATEFGKRTGLEVKFFLEQKRYIERMLKTLSSNAVGGMIVVVLLLALFLGWRMGTMIALAIPASLISALVGLWLLGQPLSGVAVFGLVLVLGMVVDGAIVVGEVTDRIWREGALPPRAADAALNEVGTPVVAAALTTMAAFIPMIFMPGVSGQFMRVLPTVVSVALLGSILADHVLLPAAFAFIAERRPPQGKSSAWKERLGGPFVAAYLATLRLALRRKILVVLATGLAIGTAVGVVGSGALGFEFFPRADTGIFWVDLEMPPGTRLDTTSTFLEPIERRLGEIPEVESRVATLGDSGRLSPDINATGSGIGAEWARINVELVGPMDRELKQFELADQLRKEFEAVVGAKVSVGERQEGPPQGAPVAIRVRGDDFMELRRASRAVEEALRETAGTRDVRSDLLEGRPEIRFHLRRGGGGPGAGRPPAGGARAPPRAGGVHGLTAADVARALQLSVFGVEVARYVDGDDALDVRLTVGDGRDLSLETLQRIPLRTPMGAVVPLEEVADVEIVGGFQRIIRRNYKRTVTVRSELADGVSSDAVRAAVKKRVEALSLPASITLEYEGDNVERDRSFGALLQIYPIALILIFVILVAQFGSFTQPLCVVAMIPLAFIGSILGLALSGKAFGFMAGVGMVALSGIVVNDSIVMVDAINQFRAEGRSLFDAAMAAGRRRFRAVWLTTLTTLGGLGPFALALTDGAEFWQPLAITICSGLLSATALTLVVLPAAYCMVAPVSEAVWSAFKGWLRLGRGYEAGPEDAPEQ